MPRKRALTWQIVNNQAEPLSEDLMRPQIVTARPLRSQSVTSSAGRGGRRYLPHAFTEPRARMAANTLNSPRAVAMSVYVIRAVVKMRLALGPNDVLCILHSSFCTLHSPRPPPQPPKPEIGFHVKEDAVPYRTRRRGKA